jgi:hypothetical protein
MDDGSSIAFAGLWERWKEPASGETVKSFTIVITFIQRNMRADPQPDAGDPWARIGNVKNDAALIERLNST